MTLSGNIILITGAGRGLGRRLAEELGQHGATIAVNDINPDSAAETARLVEAAGGRARTYLADVSKKFPVQAMLNAIEDDWGRLDVLIHNARVVPQKPVLDMDEWDWRRTLDVNLTGAFVLLQVAGRQMRAAGTGTIILPIQRSPEAAHIAAYESARRGLEGLASAAARELAAEGVQLHTVEYQAGKYGEVWRMVKSVVRSP